MHATATGTEVAQYLPNITACTSGDKKLKKKKKWCKESINKLMTKRQKSYYNDKNALKQNVNDMSKTITDNNHNHIKSNFKIFLCMNLNFSETQTT